MTFRVCYLLAWSLRLTCPLSCFCLVFVALGGFALRFDVCGSMVVVLLVLGHLAVT